MAAATRAHAASRWATEDINQAWCVCAVCDERCTEVPQHVARRVARRRSALTPLAARIDGGELTRMGHPKLTWRLSAVPAALLAQYRVVDTSYPAVSELVLSPAGTKRLLNGSRVYNVCANCMSGLEGTSSHPPPLSLANGMIVGSAAAVDPLLQSLQSVEESCCALVSVKGAVEFVTQSGTKGNLRVKGHVLGCVWRHCASAGGAMAATLTCVCMCVVPPRRYTSAAMKLAEFLPNAGMVT